MIKRAALIGLGTMGPGIAARLARGGIDVAAYDSSPAAIERSRAMLDTVNGVLDRLEIAAPASGAGNISFADSLADAVAGAELVIENVPENIEIKAELYRAIDPLIAASVHRRVRYLRHSDHQAAGFHFASRPHGGHALVEPAAHHPDDRGHAGEQTDAAAVAAITRSDPRHRPAAGGGEEGRARLRREPRALCAAARGVDLVERGVIDPEDLDTCVSWGIGYKIAVVGPMALLDMAGLDIYQSVSSFLNAELCNRADVAPLVARQDRGQETWASRPAEACSAMRPEPFRHCRRSARGSWWRCAAFSKGAADECGLPLFAHEAICRWPRRPMLAGHQRLRANAAVQADRGARFIGAPGDAAPQALRPACSPACR